jgi:hypothetical protein
MASPSEVNYLERTEIHDRDFQYFSIVQDVYGVPVDEVSSHAVPRVSAQLGDLSEFLTLAPWMSSSLMHCYRRMKRKGLFSSQAFYS